MEKTNITIIGAGVVGLAVAYELAKAHKDIFIIERNLSFGQETSSRNSEVIHAGLYYPKDSLKRRTCVEGKDLLYDFCVQHKITHAKTGKLIVAIDSSETEELEKLFQKGRDNGVHDVKWLNSDEIKKIEPNIRAEAAIFSPSTGILDTHNRQKPLN